MARPTQQPVAIVTGGSTGIGLAIAQRFAQDQFAVVICARDATALQTARERIEALKRECLALALDLSETGAPRDLIARTLDHFGRIDVLVNNAARAPRLPLEQITVEEFRRTQALNMEAIFHATQAVWPLFREQGGGVIVNISSLASVDPVSGFSIYGASKAWVNLFTRACADEGRRHNIRVFCVAPGAVETRMLRGALPDFPPERCLTPDQVAAVVRQLCAEELACATGQTIFVRK